jgi:hypothetical protein
MVDKNQSLPTSENWVRQELDRLNQEIDGWPSWMRNLVAREVDRLAPRPEVEGEKTLD